MSDGMLTHESAYQIVKEARSDYGPVLDHEVKSLDAVRVRILCEMLLCREHDDWYWGDATPNVSKSIHLHCAALRRTSDRPTQSVRRAAALLAWSYASLAHDSDDAFLLLESVVAYARGDESGLLPAGLWHQLRSVQAVWRLNRGVPENLNILSDYEQKAWQDVAHWEYQARGKWAGVSAWIDDKVDWLFDKVPADLVEVITKAIQGGLLALSDVAEYLVRDKALLDEVRKKGFGATTIRELRKVPLEVLDPTSAESLSAGKILAGLEGGGAGAGGLVLIAADIPVLIQVQLRFVMQIAHTYGFETESQRERMFVINLIGVASAENATKAAFLNNLNRIAMDVAKGVAWKDLEEHAFVALVRKLAERLGVSLTKKKLGQLIPIVGALVGGGVNYQNTHDVLTAARMTYRKRWLIERCERERTNRGDGPD